MKKMTKKEKTLRYHLQRPPHNIAESDLDYALEQIALIKQNKKKDAKFCNEHSLDLFEIKKDVARWKLRG